MSYEPIEMENEEPAPESRIPLDLQLRFVEWSRGYSLDGVPIATSGTFLKKQMWSAVRAVGVRVPLVEHNSEMRFLRGTLILNERRESLWRATWLAVQTELTKYQAALCEQPI